jgi:hypothetical protein
MDQKRLVDKIGRWSLPAATLISASMVMYVWKDFDKQNHEHTIFKTYIRDNLAPNALYFKTNMYDVIKDFPIEVRNEDVDGNGTYESILIFPNQITNELESRLLEQEGNQVKVREFEVIDGKIYYL